MEYKCEICAKEIVFPNKFAIQTGTSKRFYYFRTYNGIKQKIKKTATYCTERCYKKKRFA